MARVTMIKVDVEEVLEEIWQKFTFDIEASSDIYNDEMLPDNIEDVKDMMFYDVRTASAQLRVLEIMGLIDEDECSDMIDKAEQYKDETINRLTENK